MLTSVAFFLGHSVAQHNSTQVNLNIYERAATQWIHSHTRNSNAPNAKLGITS